MDKITRHFEAMQENMGTALAVILILILIPVVIGLPFLWAWICQQVWNYGVVWLVAQFGASVPSIKYWTAMGLYIAIRGIRSLLTVRVKKES